MIQLIKNVFRLALLLLLGAGLLFSYARFLEPRFIDETRLVLTDTNIDGPLPAGFNAPLKAAVIADLHFGPYYTPKDFQRVVERINAMEPDLVFFLGDLIDNYQSYEGDTDDIIQLLSAIKTSGRATVTMENDVVHDKFAVYGNHDYGGGLEHHYRDIMEASGFHVLINETVTLDRWDLTITGIDDMVIGYGDPSCAEALPEDSYNIVLSHVPDICTELSDDPVDLMLSGHTHGGQITVPLLSDYVLPPYGRIFVRGEYPFENERNMMLYVNRGLGTTKLPLRFLASPELTEVILK
ncbi:MAG: metallophosphoesterase [Firmicutes bacterium]|nr:metallophosphoesterase [Bacillota bacterium]